MPFGPRLTGECVILRPAVAADRPARQRLGRHAEIAKMFGAARPSSGPMSAEAAAAWFERLGGSGSVEWVVEADGAFLGTARLHSFGGDGARYAVRFDDPDRLGRGFGTEVTNMVVEYAFATLGLQRIDLAVLEFNERAIRCYTRCGFVQIGRAANAAVVDGTPYDDILMALVRARLVQ
ncbi:MAG: GNAT family N-acetyltransferase [Acidimicrobiales bacterium]